MKFILTNMKLTNFLFMLRFIKSHKDCSIYDVYKVIGTYSQIAQWVKAMKENDLITMDKYGRSFKMRLTKEGKRLERSLRGLEDG